MHVFGLCVEAEINRKNPCRHRENMQPSYCEVTTAPPCCPISEFILIFLFDPDIIITCRKLRCV